VISSALNETLVLSCPENLFSDSDSDWPATAYPNVEHREDSLQSTAVSLTPRSMSMRDRIRRLFRSASPLLTSSTPTSVHIAPRGSADSRKASGILADALETRAAKDRETVRKLLPANVIQIDAAIAEAHTYASELQQLCAKARCSWNHKGRQIYVIDQVDEIVHFLDEFKCVGDIVADVDPAHVGLPWAEVRAILEVCVPHEAGFLSAS
jgi:hypothetical protein